MTTTAFFLVAILALGFLITFQIAKASEYVSVLKGEKKAIEQSNKVNAFLMVVFLLVGLVGVWYCNELFVNKTLLVVPSASDHGEQIDFMLKITLAITGFVFLLTQILLFWFAYKYQAKEGKKAFYFPHSNKLELIWTTVPAIALCVLVGFGLYYWFQITGEAPKDAIQVEVTGQQFSWIFRYPGKDNEFGRKYFANIDNSTNVLGLIYKDTAVDKLDKNRNVIGKTDLKGDPATHDDIVLTQTMYIPKDQPVKLIIGSRDVIHDVGLPHFRLKMDAVPGTPTTLWFTPKYTTDEMKKITGNPDFEYEISCDQMCGNGHYSMKGVIKVVTKQEYLLWKAQQKPAYASFAPAEAPAASTDTAKKMAVVSDLKAAVTKN
ncbi:MAG: cytochrome c oxidase subunit II [Chitinophagaceae bacterium]|uniref:cytochrome c oxidase subunit II n=1 Tax=unclassified Paraflavitalea TaxID=2798305 RepID=UPI003D356136|nr:cytochrome c oxidase subunit II [Chitinophagaceae bacterium]